MTTQTTTTTQTATTPATPKAKAQKGTKINNPFVRGAIKAMWELASTTGLTVADANRIAAKKEYDVHADNRFNRIAGGEYPLESGKGTYVWEVTGDGDPSRPIKVKNCRFIAA